ncbi:spheroidene monooxygenase [Aquirufa echingensis]|jgi:hypothetical protein|uniref:Spheroidene monooxygenase n=1 Tax=Aquirufa echingensis TaxID=3096516 RepID=A0ABW6D4K7_9BACT
MQGKFVTIRFLNFTGFQAKRHAFAEMGRSLVQCWSAPGLLFAKHLGTGAGNGFSILPNFGLYAWLGVWESPQKAEAFFLTDARWLQLAQQSNSISGWDAIPLKGKGTWNGKQPFDFSDSIPAWDGPVAVITRASIRWHKSLLFWWNVPSASKHLEGKQGLTYAKGVGEFPLLEQATFSLWESSSNLDQFAYQSKEHAPMIKKTRQYDWYSEEMFVRMGVVNQWSVVSGQWSEVIGQ